MAEHKAKKLYTLGNKYYFESVFEYRGHEYTVEYSSGYTTFEKKPAYIQHREAQDRIDRMIDNQTEINIEPATSECQKAFDRFYDYLETGEWKG